jgi:hypothetical protein
MEEGIGTFICMDCLRPKKSRRAQRCKSCVKLGSKNPMFGKKGPDCPNFGMIRSNETRKKLIESHADFSGHNNPNYGKSASAETIERLSLSHLGQLAWNRGISPSAETREKLSIANLGKRTGPENNLWQGGKSLEEYGRDFNALLKELVLTRDSHTCQICGRKENGRKLCIHHIDYNKKNNDPRSLIALCVSCHALTNFNRSSWTEFFQKTQQERELHGWCSALDLPLQTETPVESMAMAS